MSGPQPQEPGTTVATQQEPKAKVTLASALDKLRPHLLAILPRHIDLERMLKLALLASQKQPLLRQCTLESIARSVMYVGQLGLEIGRTAHLVPFRNGRTGDHECQCIPDYRGLIELAERSGRVAMVDADVIYEDDEYAIRRGTDPKIDHVPNIHGDRTAKKVVAFYAVATRSNGMKQFAVATKEEVDATRNRSRAKDSGPWVTDYVRMGMKTAVKRLSPYLPQTPELAAALELDNRFESGEASHVSDILDTADSIAAAQGDPGRGTTSLKGALKRSAGTVDTAPPADEESASPQAPAAPEAEPPAPAKSSTRSASPRPGAAAPVRGEVVPLVSAAQGKAVWQAMDAARLKADTRMEILEAVGAADTTTIPADRLDDVMAMIREA